MLVTLAQIKQGAAAYYKNEVMPNLPTEGLSGFGVSFAATLAIGYLDKALTKLAQHPLVSMFEIVNEKGQVEMEALAEALAFAMPETGLSVPISKTEKITFRADDAAKLCEYIAK